MLQNIFPKIKYEYILPLRTFQTSQRRDLCVRNRLSTLLGSTLTRSSGKQGFNNANGGRGIDLGRSIRPFPDRRLKRYPAVIVSVWRTDGHGSRTGSRSTLTQRVDILIFNGHRFSALWTSKLTTRWGWGRKGSR